MKKIERLVFCAVWMFGVACGSTYGIRAPRTPLSATPETATVVFLRPSTLAGNALAQILGEDGRFLAELRPRQYSVVTVTPGEHTFLAVVNWDNNVDNVARITAQAGKVYFVLVAPVVTFMGRHPNIRLDAFTTRHSDWSRLREFLTSCEPVVLEQPRTDEMWARRERWMADRLRNAEREWSRYNAENIDSHTVRAEDGVEPAGVGL